jgi:predicted Zn finger-like uncharacterized protein
MLVTTCRHCGARFRVLPEQLNQRQGMVRCGECLEVFNGFESLKGYGTGAATPQPAIRQTEAAHPPAPAESVPAAVTPQLDDAVADLVAEPAATATEAGRDEAPATKAEDDESATSGVEAPARTVPAAFEQAPPVRPARAWAFGVALLAITLGLQVAYAYRAEIAQRYPALRAPLESACEPLRCTVAWANDETALKLEESDLVEVPGKPGQIALQARIRNLSTSAQQFPHIELTLSDASGQTAIRRVLRPADYLGHAPAPGEVMAPGSDTLLSLRFDTGSAKPTGYELLLFYP